MPPPPPPLHVRVWRQITNSPQAQAVALATLERLAEYGIKKLIKNSDKIGVILSQMEGRGIPVKEIADVATLIFEGINSGLSE